MEGYQTMMNKIQIRDGSNNSNRSNKWLAPNRFTGVFFRPRTDIGSFSPMQITTGAQQTSNNSDLDRILEYTQTPSLENIKKHNRTERYKVEKNQFSFTNQMKKMKSDVKEIDSRMSGIARANNLFI